MATLAAILSVILFFGGIIGLVRPRWVRMANRKQATLAVVLGFALAVLSAAGQETATAPATQPATYGTLAIDDVTVSGREIRVSGYTDLPDGSEIVVRISKESVPSFRAEAIAIVATGRYSATFTYPDRPDLAGAAFSVSATFSPPRQPEAVKTAVGSAGERLSGPLVQEGIVGRYLSASRQDSLNLAVRTDYQFVSPDNFPADSPEQSMASYLAAWRERDFERMTQLSVHSWRQQQDAIAATAARYDLKYPFEARDLKVLALSGVRADIEVVVSYVSAVGPQAPATVRMKALLFKEDASGQPTPAGRWLVSPSSIEEEAMN